MGAVVLFGVWRNSKLVRTRTIFYTVWLTSKTVELIKQNVFRGKQENALIGMPRNSLFHRKLKFSADRRFCSITDGMFHTTKKDLALKISKT